MRLALGSRTGLATTDSALLNYTVVKSQNATPRTDTTGTEGALTAVMERFAA